MSRKHLPFTQTEDRRFWAYYVEAETQPLPCILCGRTPGKDEPVLETLKGEPKLLCSSCVTTANTGFFDLNLAAHPAGATDLLEKGDFPW